MSVWTQVDEFTTRFYNDRFIDALEIAEKIFGHINEEQKPPKLAYACQIDFILLSVGKMLEESDSTSKPVCKSYLNTIEFLSQDSNDDEYRIKNNMQGIFGSLCNIIKRERDNVDIVSQYCRIVRQLSSELYILSPTDSPVMFKQSLKIAVECLAKQPETPFYYDTTYDKTDFRTDVLTLLQQYYLHSNYSFFFAVDTRKRAEMEIYVAAVEELGTTDRPPVTNGLFTTLKRAMIIFPDTRQLLFAAIIHAMSRVARDAPQFMSTTLNYILDAIKSENIRVRFAAIRSLGNLIRPADLYNRMSQQDYKTMIELVINRDLEQMVRTDNIDVFNNFLRVTYWLCNDQDSVSFGFRMLYEIAIRLKALNAPPPYVLELLPYFNWSEGKIDNVNRMHIFPMIDQVLEVVQKQQKDESLTEYEPYAQDFLIMAAQAQTGDMRFSQEQIDSIKKIVESEDKLSIYLRYGILSAFAEKKQLRLLLDCDVEEWLNAFIKSVIETMSSDYKENVFGTHGNILNSLTEVFRNYIRIDSEHSEDFKKTWLAQTLVGIETCFQGDIFARKAAREAVELLAQLCLIYQEEAVPVFARIGAVEMIDTLNRVSLRYPLDCLDAIDAMLTCTIRTTPLQDIKVRRLQLIAAYTWEKTILRRINKTIEIIMRNNEQ